MQLKRPTTINRASTFRDAVRDLEDQGVQGVQSAVDHFVEALRAAGDNLPIRPVDGQAVHHLDNPGVGPKGRGQFGLMLSRTTRPDGSSVFTLIDIWLRERGLHGP